MRIAPHLNENGARNRANLCAGPRGFKAGRGTVSTEVEGISQLSVVGDQ